MAFFFKPLTLTLTLIRHCQGQTMLSRLILTTFFLKSGAFSVYSIRIQNISSDNDHQHRSRLVYTTFFAFSKVDSWSTLRSVIGTKSSSLSLPNFIFTLHRNSITLRKILFYYIIRSIKIVSSQIFQPFKIYTGPSQIIFNEFAK